MAARAKRAASASGNAKDATDPSKRMKVVDSSDESATDAEQSDGEGSKSAPTAKVDSFVAPTTLVKANSPALSSNYDDSDMEDAPNADAAVKAAEKNQAQPEDTASDGAGGKSVKKTGKPNDNVAEESGFEDVVVCDCATVDLPFVKVIKIALRNNNFKDLNFKCEDNINIQAHKIIVVPLSSMLSKTLTKMPNKRDIPIHFPSTVVKAMLRYLYLGSYPVDKAFKGEWDLPKAGETETTIEYHLKVLQLAAYMGIPRLEQVATSNLKTALKAGQFDDKIYNKLKEPPKKSGDKKAPPPEVPFGVHEAIIEGGARKVKREVDAGIDRDIAFQSVARNIDSGYLGDLIQAVGNALGQQFRLYLRCPHCASHIRVKEGKSKDFACTREDCGIQRALGMLCPDDRVVGAAGGEKLLALEKAGA